MKYRIMVSIELEAESKEDAADTITDFLKEEADVDWDAEVVSADRIKE